jgi:hypothetical protein
MKMCSVCLELFISVSEICTENFFARHIQILNPDDNFNIHIMVPHRIIADSDGTSGYLPEKCLLYVRNLILQTAN